MSKGSCVRGPMRRKRLTITRRSIVALVAAVGVAVAALAGSVRTAGATTAANAPTASNFCTSSSVSSIKSNFNGTAIAAGHVIWFTADLTKVTGLPSTGTTTLRFENQSIANVGSLGTVTPPNSIITFSPGATPSATFDTGQNAWLITLPNNFGGEGLLAAFPVVSPGLPGGGVSPTWTGTFDSTTPGLGVSWQWQAATYNPGFPTSPSSFNSLGVVVANAAQTGTPVNEESLKDGGGATGGGGSNFTGSHSGTASFTPCTPTHPNIYLGYADTYFTHGDPAGLPWTGLPNTLVIGCDLNPNGGGKAPSDNCPVFTADQVGQQSPFLGQDEYDAGAIRIDNVDTNPLVVTGASVQIGPCTYNPWPNLNISIAPAHTLVLTQTGGANPCGTTVVGNYNFDTSESFFPISGYVDGSGAACSNDNATPVVTLQTSQGTITIKDTGQILNTGGVDPPDCLLNTNEFHSFTQVSP